jgi:hypothetical protein
MKRASSGQVVRIIGGSLSGLRGPQRSFMPCGNVRSRTGAGLGRSRPMLGLDRPDSRSMPFYTQT